MNAGDIVQDNPVDAMMDGWTQVQHNDYSRIEIGIIVQFVDGGNVGSPIQRDGTTINVRWLDGVDGPYLCYHHREELSLYCPMWEVF